jgi:hypothetical protein
MWRLSNAQALIFIAAVVVVGTCAAAARFCSSVVAVAN